MTFHAVGPVGVLGGSKLGKLRAVGRVVMLQKRASMEGNKQL